MFNSKIKHAAVVQRKAFNPFNGSSDIDVPLVSLSWLMISPGSLDGITAF